MRFPIAVSVLVLLATPAAASAQSKDVGEMTDALRDPATQAQITTLVSALSEVLLDLDVSPIVEAAESIADEPLPVPDGATVRDLAPEADVLPEVIEQELPQALDRMAEMGDAMQSMVPLLRGLAEQMKQIIGESAVSVR